jgi:hypothetical protein
VRSQPNRSASEVLRELWERPAVQDHLHAMGLRTRTLEAALAALGPFGEVRLGTSGDPRRAFCMVRMPDRVTVCHQNGHATIVTLKCLVECLELIGEHAEAGVGQLTDWLATVHR